MKKNISTKNVIPFNQENLLQYIRHKRGLKFQNAHLAATFGVPSGDMRSMLDKLLEEEQIQTCVIGNNRRFFVPLPGQSNSNNNPQYKPPQPRVFREYNSKANPQMQAIKERVKEMYPDGRGFISIHTGLGRLEDYRVFGDQY
ncbi:hypothetical protein H8L32_16995 [Undibacterium sp. CY18W]|uniref:Uncharacterized protein n=1 Tax=Undibacterium hunanense TaxID=2762292 RepID=A0ABR6ZTL7_9BURK|nr:hypothetical protein [Undibacterium hunanense]MBC3919192.1 hypothetical protein [Undibacterium hunanense]